MKFTFNDYAEAKQWLINNGYYEKFLSNPFSVDGYSLVSYANEVYEKLGG